MSASPSMTSQELIDYIKSEGQIPVSQKTFLDADFLRFLNSEFMVGLVPSVLQVHEEYFTVEEIINITPGQNKYDIPYRAIGGRLRDISYRQDVLENKIYPLSRVAIDDVPFFSNGESTGLGVSHYYMQGNQIILLTVPQGGSLVLKYFLRPNQLVMDDEVGVITTLTPSGSNTIITLDASPSAFTASELYDIIQGPSNHRTKDWDITPVSVNNAANQITFLTANLPSDIAVGDHVCLAGESKVPQCPPELHPILAHRVVQRCMEALGDREGLESSTMKINELEKKTFNLIDNRVESSTTKVNNFFSPMRAARRWRRRGWYR